MSSPWSPPSPVSPSIHLGRLVGGDHPPFVVAALDGGKLGSLAEALAAVDAVALAACDAVKLVCLPWDWAPRVVARAGDRGLRVIAPAPDEDAIARLDWLGVDALDVFVDWADVALLRAAARTGRPLVLGAASATAADLDGALGIARAEGAHGVAIVQRMLAGGLADLEGRHAHAAVLGVSARLGDRAIPGAALACGARILEVRVPRRLDAGDLAAVVRGADLAWGAVGVAPYRWATN